jgi:hypothetical protein
LFAFFKPFFQLRNPTKFYEPKPPPIGEFVRTFFGFFSSHFTRFADLFSFHQSIPQSKYFRLAANLATIRNNITNHFARFANQIQAVFYLAMNI